ncbi:MAG: flagellar biosynthetic protein FliR [Paracoccaceae bacterium]
MGNLLLDQSSGIPGLSLQNVVEQLSVFFLSSIRIGAFLISSPFFGAQSIPLQVRIITSILLGFAFHSQSASMQISNFDNLDLVRVVFAEILIGLVVGLFVSILFASVALAGEKIATSGGLGFAAQVDPNSGGQTPVISNILTLFLIVIFLSVDGHLALIRAIHFSYEILPMGISLELQNASKFGVDAAGAMFEIAAVIMLPIVILLLMTNFTVGVVTRSAPQLNLFSFGFPITLLVVFLGLYASATPLGYAMEELVEFSLSFVDQFFESISNGQ